MKASWAAIALAIGSSACGEPVPTEPSSRPAEHVVAPPTPTPQPPVDAAIDAAVPDAAPTIDPAARVLLERALAALGDPARVRRIATIVRRGRTRVIGTRWNARHDDWVRFPDRTRVEDDIWPSIAGLDGDQAWTKLDDSPAKPAHDNVAHELREGVWSDPARILVHLLDGGDAEVSAPASADAIAGKPVDEIAYRRGAYAGTLRFDRATSRLVQRVYRVGPRPNGDQFDVTNTYSNFRRVDGVWLPFVHASIEHHPNKQIRSETRWQSIELDKPLADSLFTIPP